VGIEKGKN